MLGSTPLSGILGCGVDGKDHAAVKKYIRECCDAGLSILLCKPGTKEPFDGRTSRKRTADDKAARTAAREAGNRNWMKVRSPSGLALATTDKNMLTKKNGYLDEYIRRYSTFEDVEVECYEDGEPVATAVGRSDEPITTQVVTQMVDPVHVNIAVEVGGSGLIVIDVDTPEQLASFYSVCEVTEEDIVAGEVVPLTVTSPGAQDENGNWVHHDGGHFYFTVPESVRHTIPRSMGSFNWPGPDGEAKNGFAVLWDRRIVLIPPSVRPEGAYERLGQDYDITEAAPWLLDTIITMGAERQERIDRANADVDDDNEISQWSVSAPWTELMPEGWTETNKNDQCGCEIWTAPGDHSSWKSATAHDDGCSDGRYNNGGALHIWTDNPGEPFEEYLAGTSGSKTLSKLQVVALRDYEGSIPKALDAMGLSQTKVTEIEKELGAAPNAIENEDGGHTSNLDQDIALPETEPDWITCVPCNTVHHPDDPSIGQDSDGDWWHLEEDGNSHLMEDEPPYDEPAPFDTPSSEHPLGEPDEVDESEVFDCGIQGVPVIAPFLYWRGLPAPQFVIDGLLEHNALSLMIGPSNVGKSTVALDMACHIAMGRSYYGRKTLKTKVLYLPGEGMPGALQRVEAWAHAHGVDPSELSDGIRFGDSIIRLNASTEAWAAIAGYLVHQKVGLIIFDTFARMSLGIEENSATDVGRAIERFDQIKRITGAGVMVVHHTGKADKTVARGSSALQAAVESELLISEAQWTFEEAGLVAEDGTVPDGKPIQLFTTKQKNAEAMESPMPMLLKNYSPLNAALITHANGELDPMLGNITLARPNPETVVETAIRIQAFLADFTAQGATRAELMNGVRMDPYTAGRTDGRRAWRQQINRAVDMAVRFEVIETVTGKATGTRYRPGDTTPTEARTRATDEILSDTGGQMGTRDE